MKQIREDMLYPPTIIVQHASKATLGTSLPNDVGGPIQSATVKIDGAPVMPTDVPTLTQSATADDTDSTDNFASIAAPATVISRRFDWQELTRLTRRLAEMGADDTLPVFLARHLMVAGEFRLGRLGQLSAQAPRLSTRYIRDYLSLGFGIAKRREIFLYHHRYIAKTFDAKLFDEILSDIGCVLWTQVGETETYQIRLETDRSFYGEGDLILGFYAGHTRLYDLSLSIAPGAALGFADKAVVIMSRVQGRKLFPEIRTATKACSDILPSHLLLAAAEGLAAAFSITTLLGVAGERQLSYRWLVPGAYRFDYNGFWSEFLQERHGDLFWGAAPLRRKPIAEVAATHRRRAQRKRRFRDALTEQVRHTLASRIRS